VLQRPKRRFCSSLRCSSLPARNSCFRKRASVSIFGYLSEDFAFAGSSSSILTTRLRSVSSGEADEFGCKSVALRCDFDFRILSLEGKPRSACDVRVCLRLHHLCRSRLHIRGITCSGYDERVFRAHPMQKSCGGCRNNMIRY
jgi:hypothetical protein